MIHPRTLADRKAAMLGVNVRDDLRAAPPASEATELVDTAQRTASPIPLSATSSPAGCEGEPCPAGNTQHEEEQRMEYENPAETIRDILAQLRQNVKDATTSLDSAKSALSAALAEFQPAPKVRKVRAPKVQPDQPKPARKARVVSQAVKQPDGSVKFAETP